MNIRIRIGLILLLVTAVLSLLILVSGLSRVPMSAAWTNYLPKGTASTLDRGLNNSVLFAFLPQIPGPVLEALSMVMLILFPLALMVTLLSREMRRRLLNDLKTVVLYLVLVAAFLILHRRLSDILTTQSTLGGGSSEPAIPDFVKNPPSLLLFLIAILLLVSAIGAGWILWQRYQRRRWLELIALGTEETLADLHAGVDFGNTIVAYYFKMCEILRWQRRIERAGNYTPNEFFQQLEQIGLGSPEVCQLTNLFEKVRYGGEAFTNRDKETAVECLTTISRNLRRSSFEGGSDQRSQKTTNVL